MRKFITLASVVALAAGSASCSNAREVTNSAGDVLARTSIIGPSALTEARSGGGGGKGGGKNGGSTDTSSSMALIMVTDKNGNGLPNWSDTVTFSVSTTATSEPTVELLCSQNGVVVYGVVAGFYDGYAWPWRQSMTLSSSAWTGGTAACTAKLFPLGVKSTVLASVTFTAGA